MSRADSQPIPNSVARDAGAPIALADIASPLVREGLRYWEEKRGGRPWPTRDDLIPREIAKFIRNVVLVRTVGGGTDYEFRIVGDAAVAAHGFSFQNMLVSQLDTKIDGYSTVIKNFYDYVLRKCTAVALRGRLIHVERGYCRHESIYLPLGPDDKTIDHIFIVAQYEIEDRLRG